MFFIVLLCSSVIAEGYVIGQSNPSSNSDSGGIIGKLTGIFAVFISVVKNIFSSITGLLVGDPVTSAKGLLVGDPVTNAKSLLSDADRESSYIGISPQFVGSIIARISSKTTDLKSNTIPFYSASYDVASKVFHQSSEEFEEFLAKSPETDIGAPKDFVNKQLKDNLLLCQRNRLFDKSYNVVNKDYYNENDYGDCYPLYDSVSPTVRMVIIASYYSLMSRMLSGTISAMIAVASIDANNYNTDLDAVVILLKSANADKSPFYKILLKINGDLYAQVAELQRQGQGNKKILNPDSEVHNLYNGEILYEAKEICQLQMELIVAYEEGLLNMPNSHVSDAKKTPVNNPYPTLPMYLHLAGSTQLKIQAMVSRIRILQSSIDDLINTNANWALGDVFKSTSKKDLGVDFSSTGSYNRLCFNFADSAWKNKDTREPISRYISLDSPLITQYIFFNAPAFDKATYAQLGENRDAYNQYIKTFYETSKTINVNYDSTPMDVSSGSPTPPNLDTLLAEVLPRISSSSIFYLPPNYYGKEYGTNGDKHLREYAANYLFAIADEDLKIKMRNVEDSKFWLMMGTNVGLIVGTLGMGLVLNLVKLPATLAAGLAVSQATLNAIALGINLASIKTSIFDAAEACSTILLDKQLGAPDVKKMTDLVLDIDSNAISNYNACVNAQLYVGGNAAIVLAPNFISYLISKGKFVALKNLMNKFKLKIQNNNIVGGGLPDTYLTPCQAAKLEAAREQAASLRRAAAGRDAVLEPSPERLTTKEVGNVVLEPTSVGSTSKPKLTENGNLVPVADDMLFPEERERVADLFQKSQNEKRKVLVDFENKFREERSAWFRGGKVGPEPQGISATDEFLNDFKLYQERYPKLELKSVRSTAKYDGLKIEYDSLGEKIKALKATGDPADLGHAMSLQAERNLIAKDMDNLKKIIDDLAGELQFVGKKIKDYDNLFSGFFEQGGAAYDARSGSNDILVIRSADGNAAGMINAKPSTNPLVIEILENPEGIDAALKEHAEWLSGVIGLDVPSHGFGSHSFGIVDDIRILNHGLNTGEIIGIAGKNINPVIGNLQASSIVRDMFDGAKNAGLKSLVLEAPSESVEGFYSAIARRCGWTPIVHNDMFGARSITSIAGIGEYPLTPKVVEFRLNGAKP